MILADHPELVAAGSTLLALLGLMPRRHRQPPAPKALTRLEHAKREYVRSPIEPWTVEGQEEIAQLEVDVLALIESGDEDLRWTPPPSPYGVSMAQMTQALQALAAGGTRMREGALSAQKTPTLPPATPRLVAMEHRDLILQRGDGTQQNLCKCGACRAPDEPMFDVPLMEGPNGAYRPLPLTRISE